jgi:hypothetical protein
MKSETTTVSKLVKQLEGFKKEMGDVKVYVVHHNADALDVDGLVHFNGLSSRLAGMKTVKGDESGVLIFQSDEILRS